MARAVALAGNLAYVADDSSVQVIDISNPNNPSFEGSLAETADDMAVTGNRLYAVDGFNFRSIDISNPQAPSLLGVIGGIEANRVDAAGNRAYVTEQLFMGNRVRGAVGVVDVSVDAQPVSIQDILIPGAANSVDMDGGFVYVGDTAATIDVIQIGP